MTQDEIIELANEAELCQCIWIDDAYNETVQSVIRFAKLVAAKERDELIDLVAFYGGSVELEAAIRARGK
jgi:hypothetical protein